MRKEREIVGSGLEHTVYSASFPPETVLKVPKPVSLAGVTLMGGADRIREELRFAYATTEGTDVIVPHSRVFKFRKGYVIAQQRIHEDNSVVIGERISNTNNLFLITKYQSNPTNFASQNGNVYWLDFTEGRANRLFLATRLFDREKILRFKTARRKWKNKLKKRMNKLQRINN